MGVGGITEVAAVTGVAGARDPCPVVSYMLIRS